jgi:PilZ domain-containing protein
MTKEPKQPTRSFTRRQADIPVLLSLGDKAPAMPQAASIVDLSFLGMRVRAEAPLKPGQKVHVTAMTGPSAIVPGQVVWVGERGSVAEGQAGLRYINPMHARITPR